MFQIFFLTFNFNLFHVFLLYTILFYLFSRIGNCDEIYKNLDQLSKKVKNELIYKAIDETRKCKIFTLH